MRANRNRDGLVPEAPDMKRRKPPHWVRMKARQILKGFDDPNQQAWIAQALIEIATDPDKPNEGLPVPPCLEEKLNEIPEVKLEDFKGDEEFDPFSVDSYKLGSS